MGALLFVLIYLLNALRTGWKQYVAFRTVPVDPDQHFLLGHTPRVSKVSAARVVPFLPQSAKNSAYYLLMLIHKVN